MSGEAQVPRPRSDRRSPISRFPPSVTIHRLALSHRRTFCLFFPSYFCSWATLRLFLWRPSSLVGFEAVIELMPSSRMVTNFGRFLERKESDAGEEVLGKVGFNCPIFLTLIHHSFSWVSMIISEAFSLLPTSLRPKSNPICSLLALGIVMSLSDGLANVGSKYNSMGFYQMDEIAVSPTIVLA
ncbi:nucleotide-sugar uncharacterized transporter 2-like [Musa acuminata AAA Group]|uniref:nucleotide-sugar uncharacterized transporter 2-like n=1 Tax=Musa acuminata AAA Group TaxID=214697 RepID=UPI0031D9E298